MKRLIIVSNRLPIKITQDRDGISYVRSEGGLATGLDSMSIPMEKHWIGWPGMHFEDNRKREMIRNELEAQMIHPVFLDHEQIQNFYEGYSNSTIWPLFHYFFVYTTHDTIYWKAYKEVNEIFLKEVLKVAQADDLVWIHDYHLMLLPGLLREHLCPCRIGFFLHIPFPSYELFRTLAERAEILTGLLGADLIGFHTFDYMRHFISSTYRILGLEYNINEVTYQNRPVRIDNFPMGINFDLYHNISEKPEVRQHIKQFTEEFENRRIIFSVDRLDYSKGILHRLKAFDLFLETYPVYRRNVVLILLVVPSRDSVEKYHDLKTKIDEFVGYLNGKYSDIDWMPVHYLYRSFDMEQLSALYYIADVALVTPLRDGMNLIAKEYVAVKKNKPGVLILSEMAGAFIELDEAIRVNPNNLDEIKDALFFALNIPEAEQIEKLKKMQLALGKQNISKWTNDFISELEQVGRKRLKLDEKFIDTDNIDLITEKYKNTTKRLFLLDYDGTLTGYKRDPSAVKPDQNLLRLLGDLCVDRQNLVVIISGRERTFLDECFPQREIVLISEHGAFRREKLKWTRNYDIDENWKEEIHAIMQKITEKTPGSFIETKESSMVWHYRKTDLWLADLRLNQLIDNLITPCSKMNLQIMRGNKIIEVKVSGVDKGTSAIRMVRRKSWEFILAAGDDTTDEDMFKVLPAYAFTIKIGSYSHNARFNLSTHIELLNLLDKLASP
jgi:trehalose 6-phosphate synthase/phosphatase